VSGLPREGYLPSAHTEKRTGEFGKPGKRHSRDKEKLKQQIDNLMPTWAVRLLIPSWLTQVRKNRSRARMAFRSVIASAV
jgi:hypothetical protein